MFTYELDKQLQDAAKKVEQAVEHVKQVNEFWFNSVVSTWKTLLKTK